MSGNKHKKIAFNYFGAKFSWLENLYENFPTNFTHLVELFGGSLSVSINYTGNVIKTVNEINTDITNFFEVLRDHEGELIRLLLLTPCSESEYKNCWVYSENKIEQARRFYVRVRQSFFGLGAQRKNKGWHMAKQHVNAQGGETISKWNNAIEKLHEVAEVIRSNFQIINGSYEAVIDRLDFDRVFFYADPPYPIECRASRNDYKFEFSDDDHRSLSEKLHSVKGHAMVSGYDCALMNELYKDWNKTIFRSKQNSIRSGKVVQEVIWTNYLPEQQRKLF